MEKCSLLQQLFSHPHILDQQVPLLLPLPPSPPSPPSFPSFPSLLPLSPSFPLPSPLLPLLPPLPLLPSQKECGAGSNSLGQAPRNPYPYP